VNLDLDPSVKKNADPDPGHKLKNKTKIFIDKINVGFK
jgi:hypothetical protein